MEIYLEMLWEIMLWKDHVRRGLAVQKIILIWVFFKLLWVFCLLKFQKSREILINPSIGGKNCPRKMERKKKCRQMPCPANTKYWYQGSWRYEENFVMNIF